MSFLEFEPSPSRPGWAYDVFLSFRGEDTRNKFTDHLYAALVQAGIHTFRDDDELPRGEDISSQLLKAIQESKISVVVFSQGYAASTWCLDELAKIMECRDTIGQIVLPIFYDIDPSDVRKQAGSFAEAFDRYEEWFKEEMEKVNKWRKALMGAANLSGWDLHSSAAKGHESKFIQKIVKDALSKLNPKCLNVATHPVGIDSRVKDVIALLNVGTDGVVIVGIHGMPGIGKTAIAKAVFNQLCHRFEESRCLLNVKKISEQPNGLVQLQKELLFGTVKRKFWIDNVDEGINLIQKRYQLKRVLVVLDDLDHLDQVKALVGERNWFGAGSRIIITTRDDHLLTWVEVENRYQAGELDLDESLQLFSWHAFREPYPTKDYEELSKGLVDYVRGLPLALEVLGSYLYKRSIPEWKSAIEKLRKISHQQIQSQLRTSFDALEDDKLKEMFLDIACFFIGMDKEYVSIVLDARGFYPEISFSILVERSLITINGNNELRMHDLLRDMGREIIRQTSPDHPGKRSRLWFHEDVLDVLRKDMGTKAVKGLMLDVQSSPNMVLRTESFSRMAYLQLLQFKGAHMDLTGCFEFLSKDLTWLCWHNCSLFTLPSDFHLDNVVVLDMQHSRIIEVWRDIKWLNKLKILNLSHSRFLSRTPNFIGLPSLERLIIMGCVSLVEVHQTIGHLERLVFLNLEGCRKLKNLPESMCCLKSLETLNISSSGLKKLPENLGSMEALMEILAEGTCIKNIPSSVGELKNLRNLLLPRSWDTDLRWELASARKRKQMSILVGPTDGSKKQLVCRETTEISIKNSPPLLQSFTGLRSLRRLDVSYRYLYNHQIFIELGSLSSLQELNLAGNVFSDLPKGIVHLSKLEILILNHCRNLVSISDLPSSLKTLVASYCPSMKRLSIRTRTAPDLLLTGCIKLVEIEGLENLENKPVIYLEACDNLANNFRKSLLQVLSEGKIPEIVLPGGELPYWLDHRNDGTSLSFRLPAIAHGLTQGLIVWAVYRIGVLIKWRFSFLSITIRKKSDHTKFFSMPSYFPIALNNQEHSWVTCIPFGRLPCSMGDEEELEVSIKPSDNNKITKCGVHLIVNQPDAIGGQGTSSS